MTCKSGINKACDNSQVFSVRSSFLFLVQVTDEQEEIIDQMLRKLQSRKDQMRKAQKELNNLRSDRNKLRRDLHEKGEKKGFVQPCVLRKLHFSDLL